MFRCNGSRDANWDIELASEPVRFCFRFLADLSIWLDQYADSALFRFVVASGTKVILRVGEIGVVSRFSAYGW